jgi:glycosyltransferase involved in cell wall biosynthesis
MSIQPGLAPIPAVHTEGSSTGIERVARARAILAAIRVMPLAVAETVGMAAGNERAIVQVLSRTIDDASDYPTAVAAAHAMVRLKSRAAVDAAATILHRHDGLAAHAAWAAGSRPPEPTLVDPLADLLARGGLAGMHAQVALIGWARRGSAHVMTTLRQRLADETDPVTRHALAEALDEARPMNATALPTGAVLTSTDGLRIAQVHLGARLDADLLSAGMGDTGGIATLLVKLGAALARRDDVGQVVTIGRTTTEELPAADERHGGGQTFAPVPLDGRAATSFTESWPALVSSERGLRRVFRQLGRPDVIHLRMADVGTLAAARLAATLDIPTVFSLAPDPHALIAARERSGQLDRRSFAAADEAQALWFRVDLVERLARQAQHVVLFPRERLADDLRELVGIDIDRERGRFTVIPEGIDVAQVRQATTARPPHRRNSAVADLLERMRNLPADRHGLPIVLSVGRLNEVKGMARLVQAFATDTTLGQRATLVIVGGDLDQPNAAEAAELARIETVLAAEPELRRAVILLGHRPNAEVAGLLAVVGRGIDGLIGAHGAYACASHKEEFGLAIVEALAAGLPVVAPSVGGPATYVEDGRTGHLVDTGEVPVLAAGIHGALDLARRPGRAQYAADSMARRYDISNMAHAMVGIYDRVVAQDGTRLAS